MLRFGAVEVDLGAREVHLDGQRQHLEPQAFDLLAYLIRHRDRAVSKHELRESVWGDQFVTDAALATRVKEVRRAVGDDGERQGVIRTVRGHGYRFVATVTDARGATPVPQDAPALVGRSADVAAVRARLERGRCVTVVGPGGVGKSVLARAVVRAGAMDHATPVLRVDLAAIDEGEEVLPLLVAAAGVDGSVVDPATAVELLAARSGLLLLDTCEHVLDAVADLVERITAGPGSVRILATSRERLGVAGEQVWPLLPLAPADAIALLRERAREVAPAAVGEEDEVLDRLAECVDRLPLGLEMAAALLGVMGTEEAIGLVSTRPDLVLSPRRHAPARHRSLDRVVTGSFAALPSDARDIVVRMSCFASAVTAADVAGVAGDGEVLAGLRTLVERYVVTTDRRTEPTRYRLLETVRRHAQRLAGEQGRATDLSRSHARWFTEVAEECDRALRGPGEAAAAARLGAAAGDLRAAHRWARRHEPALAVRLSRALWLYAHSRLWAEPAGWARDLIASTALDPAAAAAAQAVVAADHAHAGRLDDAAVAAHLALSEGDPATRVIALETLSDVAVYQGRTEDAAEWATRLLAVGTDGGDVHAVAIAQVNLILSLAYSGAVAESLAALPHGDDTDLAPSDRAWLAYAAGEARMDADPVRALADLERAVRLADSVGNRLVAGVVRTSLASLAARRGDTSGALQAFAGVVAEFRRRGDVTHLVTVLRNLVPLLVEAGRPDEAVRLHAALSRDGVKVSYGEERRRVDAAVTRAVAALPPGEADRLRADGATRSLGEAIESVLAAIDRGGG